jgi:ABC-type amino acid transport substrate-binding protein
MTEEEYLDIVTARGETTEKLNKIGQPEEGKDAPPEGDREAPPEGNGETPPKGGPEGPSAENKIVFYDTLDALLMALNAGDIQNIEIYQSVARYLCAANDNLTIGFSFDGSNASDIFAQLMQENFNGNDFAFMMMENNSALRDEFNAAIASMKEDGTLDRLIKEQVDDMVEGGEIKTVELPEIPGADTVKVAVTGALPPMDYVAADGSPAGFNTAVLAEISNRIGKNIELVVVDSVGRAAALASGAVDAVFWTRTNSEAQEATVRTEEERKAKRAELDAAMTKEEVALLNELSERIDPSAYANADMPEGTIITEPYFSDVLVPVMLAGGGPQGK